MGAPVVSPGRPVTRVEELPGFVEYRHVSQEEQGA